jgi:hypothetical protein
MELQTYASRRIAINSSLVSILIVIAYNLIRDGLDFQVEQSIKVLGLALTLLNFPLLVSVYLREHRLKVLKDETAMTFVLLFFSCLIGFIGIHTGYVFFLFGAVAFVINLLGYIRRFRLIDVGVLFLVFVMGLWLIVKVWNGGLLHPMLLELLPFDARIQIDTLFHMSIAQMIKTYHIPSTGLNGVPFYHYHFGSHLIMASLASVLGMKIFDFYQLGYPAIFLPLFLKAIFTFPLVLRRSQGIDARHWVWFWLIVAGGLIGVFPLFRVLSTVAADWNLVIVSESYNVSLIFTFFFFNILFFNIEMENGAMKIQTPALVLLAILALLIGFSKVSTLFLFSCILFYLLFRFKLVKEQDRLTLNVVFRNPVLNPRKALYGLGYLVLVSLICVFVVFDTKAGDGGQVVIFHFVKTFVNASALLFVVVYYFWSFVLVGCCFLIIKFHDSASDSRPKAFYWLVIELVLIVSLIGFYPGAIRKIDGGSAAYFMDIHQWLSLALLLVIFPEVLPAIKRSIASLTKATTRKMVVGGLALLTIIGTGVMLRNLTKSIDIFIKHQYTIRTWMSGRHLGEMKFVKDITAMDFFRQRRELRANMLANLQVDRDYLALKHLYELDSLSAREKSSMTIVPKETNLLSQKYPCHKNPFLIPALTGICMKDGFAAEWCHVKNYSFEYYRQKDLENDSQLPAEVWVYNLFIDSNGAARLERDYRFN